MSIVITQLSQNQENIQAFSHNISQTTWAKESEIDTSEYTPQNINTYLHNDINTVFYATINGIFAGFACVHVMTKLYGDKWLYVDELDVGIDFQRKGVGKALMQACIAYAREIGCKELWLGTEMDNAAANALYSSIKSHEKEQFNGYTFECN